MTCLPVELRVRKDLTLPNMVLDGLEQAVHCAVPRRSRINFIRYADDFIITGKSRTILEEAIKPEVEAFLKERGLALSPEKTLITHITDGFTFLGQTFRKEAGILHFRPSTQGVLALQEKVGTIIRKLVSAPMPALTKELNAVLRGWANCHRYSVASEAFSHVDNYVFEQLWRMLHRRHPQKSSQWLFNHNWTASGRKHIFAVKAQTSKGKTRLYQVIRISSLGVRRYVKIRAEANPYEPADAAYFARRRHHKESKLLPAMSAREFHAKFDVKKKRK